MKQKRCRIQPGFASLSGEAIANMVGPKLTKYGFIPVTRDDDGMILHRPIEALGPCFEFPTIPMDCRTLDVDFEPFGMWVLDLTPDELERFDYCWDIMHDAVAPLLSALTQNDKS